MYLLLCPLKGSLNSVAVSQGRIVESLMLKKIGLMLYIASIRLVYKNKYTAQVVFLQVLCNHFNVEAQYIILCA